MAGDSKAGEAPHHSSYVDLDGIVWAWGHTVQAVRDNNSHTLIRLHSNPGRCGFTVFMQPCLGNNATNCMAEFSQAGPGGDHWMPNTPLGIY